MTFRAQVFGVSSLGIRVLILSLSVGFARDLGYLKIGWPRDPGGAWNYAVITRPPSSPLKDDVKAILRRSHVCKSFP